MENSSQTSLVDVPGELLSHILSFLDVRSLYLCFTVHPSGCSLVLIITTGKQIVLGRLHGFSLLGTTMQARLSYTFPPL